MSLLRAPTIQQREARLAYALIIPTFLIVTGLVIFPAFFNIWISFHDVGLNNLNDVFHAPFVALENYARVLNDFAFPAALTTSLIYSFGGTMASIGVGLLAALVLNQRFRGRGLVRAVLLFPYIVPVISAAFIWKWLFDPTVRGVVNWTLLNAGVLEQPLAWFGQTGVALVMVIVFESWRYFPFAMLMLLARLQAIDVTLYKAAVVDGANAWSKF
jgi:multiple sugar transport system permease protein